MLPSMTGPGSAAAPTDSEIDVLASAALRDLVQRLTEDAGPPPAEGGAQLSVKHEALNLLRILTHLQQAAARQADLAAESAARNGAGYPELGDACGISRQGARRRWPGLVSTPRPLDDPSQQWSSLMAALAPAQPRNVLLVEDDLADSLLIEEALEQGGLARSITRVSDGVEALERLQDTSAELPDIIVLDLNMPRMNGRELLTILKNDARLKVVPVVVLTTSSTPDDVEAAYQGHANAYVTKPVNLDEFLQAVQSIDTFFLNTATSPTRPHTP